MFIDNLEKLTLTLSRPNVEIMYVILTKNHRRYFRDCAVEAGSLGTSEIV